MEFQVIEEFSEGHFEGEGKPGCEDPATGNEDSPL
jgi:hypothetical protein